MSHRRFLVPDLAPELVELPPEEARHATGVLRLGVGQEVELLDGRGTVAQARLVEVTKRHVLCQVQKRRTPPPLVPRVVICPGLLKAPAMDAIFKPLVELGVAAIRPFLGERGVPHPKGATTKIDRWARLASEALKQSGAHTLPRIEPPATLERVLAAAPSQAAKLLLHESPGGPAPAALLASADPRPTELWALIGPEGGFTEAEAQAAQDAGFAPTHLPGPILRAETACITAAALLRYGFSG